MGLFKPKKDQCEPCLKFKYGNIIQNLYNEHIVNKNKERMNKDKDEKRGP